MAASKAECPFNCCSRAKVTSRIEFAEATPTAMIAPISENAQGRVGDVEHRDNAAKGGGQRQDDDKRVTKILIVHDHQKVDENGSAGEPDAHVAEGIVHALDLTQ